MRYVLDFVWNENVPSERTRMCFYTASGMLMRVEELSDSAAWHIWLNCISFRTKAAIKYFTRRPASFVTQ